MPLANSLLEEKDKNKPELKFPLEVMYCKDCSLSQLSIVVNPKVLFLKYFYRSSISKTFQQHCAQMAGQAFEMTNSYANKNNLAVDIASNDGCLLKEFKNKGFKVLGVEPAENIAKIANLNGIETICSFWGDETASAILKKYGKARIITATNVLAHVDDLNGFLNAVKILLDDNGLFIVEVPYLYNLLSKNEFDTVYHEHLSYFLVRPLKKLYDSHKLKIIKIEKYQIHGGSIRIFASKNSLSEESSIKKFQKFERSKKLYDINTYKNFDKKAKKVRKDLLNILAGIKNRNKKIAAYGASAKGNTLLNYCGIDRKIVRFIIDDTPEKQNLISPGSKIRIVDSGYLNKENPDYIILLAWNFAGEIIQKTKSVYKRKVKYIIPIPYVRVI